MMIFEFIDGGYDRAVRINWHTYRIDNISPSSMARLKRVIKKYNWDWHSFELGGYGDGNCDLYAHDVFGITEEENGEAREMLYGFLTGESLRIQPDTPCEICRKTGLDGVDVRVWTFGLPGENAPTKLLCHDCGVNDARKEL